jgi:hypothetical protein
MLCVFVRRFTQSVSVRDRRVERLFERFPENLQSASIVSSCSASQSCFHADSSGV